jgi:HSP20 family protein
MKPNTTMQKSTNPVTRMDRDRPGDPFIAPVDIVAKNDELLLVADIPGTTAEGVDIDYERGTLTLRARVEPRERGASATPILLEYGVGDYERTFQVGEGIDAQRIRAEYRNGVLTLHLPKTEAIKPRKIAVQAK